jgi:hypothetical protein
MKATVVAYLKILYRHETAEKGEDATLTSYRKCQ